MSSPFVSTADYVETDALGTTDLATVAETLATDDGSTGTEIFSTGDQSTETLNGGNLEDPVKGADVIGLAGGLAAGATVIIVIVILTAVLIIRKRRAREKQPANNGAIANGHVNSTLDTNGNNSSGQSFHHDESDYMETVKSFDHGTVPDYENPYGRVTSHLYESLQKPEGLYEIVAQNNPPNDDEVHYQNL